MPFASITYRVMIASPSDMPEERQAASDALIDWNALHGPAEGITLMAVKWESHATPEAGVRPQEAINRQLVHDSDILIGLFWTKLGTNTGVAESGTVEEIGEFVRAGKPTMLYFSSRPVDPSKIDIEQHRKLKQFKQETYKTALVGGFKDLNELKTALHKDLTNTLRRLRKTARVHPVEGGRAGPDDQKAQAERKAYEDKLLTQTYRKNFKAEVGLLVVTVIPAEPQPVPYQPDGYYYQHRLAPISNTKGVPKHEMKSELCFWPTEDRPLNSITEMSNVTGSIYAVRALCWDMPNQTPFPGANIKFRFSDFERPVAQAVQRYVNPLKELGLKGSFFVGVSVLNVKGFQMDLGMFTEDDWVIGDNDPESIQTDALTLTPDVDTTHEDRMLEFLKPSFRQVWRAFHLPGRPGFDEAGNFTGFNG